ncbi:hypothetical protein FNF27_07599 [Cafeteria roenbergensis]|uniref:Uncharacterized protein n=1 Tax=Cafeteria roenbergensis TaxID=33653 RepID=A0A5A8DJI6_CAFRO|nr:hypothetical protein FNF27_07599 [Cafeteria roenbergensis]
MAASSPTVALATALADAAAAELPSVSEARVATGRLSAAVCVDLTFSSRMGPRVVSVVWEAGDESPLPALMFWSVAENGAMGPAGLAGHEPHPDSECSLAWDADDDGSDEGALVAPEGATSCAAGPGLEPATPASEPGDRSEDGGARASAADALLADASTGAQGRVGATLRDTADDAALDGAGRAFGASVEAHPVHGRACMQIHGCDARRRLQAVLRGGESAPGGGSDSADTDVADDLSVRWSRLVAWLALHGPAAGLRLPPAAFKALLASGPSG